MDNKSFILYKRKAQINFSLFSVIIRKIQIRAGDVAQVIGSLPSKHPSSNLSTTKKEEEEEKEEEEKTSLNICCCCCCF
jgi:hypothetical protein